MITDRLKTRKPHSKLFEIQLIECMLLILLFILSYDIAGVFIYNTFSPFGILDTNLRHIVFYLLMAIILSFYKYFNFLKQSYTETIKKIIIAGFMLNAVFIVLLYFTSSIKLAANYYLTAYILQIVLLFILKVFTNFLKHKIIQNSYNLIIIEDFSAIDLIKTLKKIYTGRMAVVTYKNENLKKYVNKADNIYLTGSVTNELKNQVISYCTLEDKKIYIVPDIFEIAVKKSTIAYIGDTPIFTMESFRLTEAQKFVKRLVDIVFSIVGIVITLPIFLFAIIGIKYEDKGPVFYKQVRSGLNGQLFEVIKFRSMVVDAERDTGAVLATENDCRITKIGCLMRSVRIDEIPQFFNVLMGSMSLVGPRPERPLFVEEFSRKYSEYYYRLSVKPGITGLAQVKGNYTTTVENKMKFDLMYIINYSLPLDIKILFETVKVVLKREQAKGFDEKENTNSIFITDLDISDLERRLTKSMKAYGQSYYKNK